MSTLDLLGLLDEYDTALAYTSSLVGDLSEQQIAWRPSENSSGIGWHLGHQAAVGHFMLRNLTAAEPSIDPEIDALMDSATPEVDRRNLPGAAALSDYRHQVAQRVHFRIGQIHAGKVGAPAQLQGIATTMLTAIINHEYQHSKWIGEVREGAHGKALPPSPQSQALREVDGYLMIVNSFS